jgi:hypothetical protein
MMRLISLLILVMLCTRVVSQQPWSSRYIDSLPDFSGVGCTPAKMKVIKTVQAGEDIQAAIDDIAAKGLRGAILLKKGLYKIPGTIRIANSNIVLRGEGAETILLGTGKGQRNLISVSGTGTLKEIPGSRRAISQARVGDKFVTAADVTGLKAGDSIVVYRAATQAWISAIKMDQINQRDSATVQWKPDYYGLHYERVITKISGNKIYIDNPIVMEMDSGAIYRYTFNGRIWNVGVENLVCVSEYNGDQDKDHAWTAVYFNRVVNGWATKVSAKHFGYACVSIGYQARNITVGECRSLAPKSKITGSRRYSFNVDGQLNLVKDCFASEGRHDYVTGAKVCGPNVFYNCQAEKTHADIGPHHRWATGTLYDNIITDGEINVQDRGDWGTGHGWAGANQVLWNCTVKRAAVQNPWASAKNYAIGLKGEKSEGRLKGRPDGIWEGQNRPGLQPASLYQAQLKLRRSK